MINSILVFINLMNNYVRDADAQSRTKQSKSKGINPDIFSSFDSSYIIPIKKI